MAKKLIKVNYFYPIKKTVSGKESITSIVPILRSLQEIPKEKRILTDGEGNIQLKDINYDEECKRWELCFLRNRIDAPFKAKLNDDTNTAEALEDDEFVGQECCMLYDEQRSIIALQNNRNSMSYGGLTSFFRKYIKEGFRLSPITYKEKYSEISFEEDIQYKSIIVGYTDISKLKDLAEREDNETVKILAKIAGDISAINGKIELGVGRAKKYLGKEKLKELASFFKKNREITNTLKVKMLEDYDSIRLIDLLNNKVYDQFEISVTKDDPKTFGKILSSMHSVFDVALDEIFEKCNVFI